MSTATETAQLDVEKLSIPLLEAPGMSLEALRDNHEKVMRMLLGLSGPLPAGFLGLDASHPWMAFWPVNALWLLDRPLGTEELDRVGETILDCQHPAGGFGGGPGQPGHLAATYAAVMALAHCGTKYISQIDRPKLMKWLLTLKRADGSIRVCRRGEADPRSTYTALAVLRLLGLEKAIGWGELTANIGHYISKCQTYEGGFANQPGGEAHGGYAFCSLATLTLLDPTDAAAGLRVFCNTRKFKNWFVKQQGLVVPGFAGRTNKLVDGCYSHWVGGCWALISMLSEPSGDMTAVHHPVDSGFNRQGLEDYSIKCCQDPKGGLRDKPRKRPDAYHSNYVLCGLAAAQYRYEIGKGIFDWKAHALGAPKENRVPPINPVFGIPLDAAANVHAWAQKTLEQEKQAVTATGTITGAAAAATAAAATTAANKTHDVKHNEKSVKNDQTTDNSMRDPAAVPTSKEYQGFALYFGVTAALVLYLAWALLPASVLHHLQLSYYPSRYWAVALPAFLLMAMVYVYVALTGYNTERLTFPPNAPQTIADRDSFVQDVPLELVNAALYDGTVKRTANALSSEPTSSR